MRDEQVAEDPWADAASATSSAVWLDARSPLRALPRNLDRRQLLLIDGIGMSIDMTVLGINSSKPPWMSRWGATGPRPIGQRPFTLWWTPGP
jgi:hypothetical protein